MTASEFAFLALGLVLGVASGAALIEVLRARPPIAREVRVTVAPNAIQSRLSSTLADPAAVRDAPGPAAGGPGDRRWHDEIGATGEPPTTGRRSDDRAMTAEAETPVTAVERGTPVPTRPASVASPPAPRAPSNEPQTARPEPLWLRPAAGSTLVAVPMSLEPDPDTAVLRATAAASAVTAMRQQIGEASGSAPTATAEGSRPTAETATPEPDPGVTGRGSGATEDDPAPAPDGPCAEERRVAEERCAVASLARQGAELAAAALHRAQRTYDEHVARADAAAAAADPRAVRTAKEQAQRQFHDARGLARTREDIESGARLWLAEINRINHDTRESALAAERDRAAAAALGANLERLAVEADAARISAEQADEACLAARQVVADCDESRRLAAAAAARARQPEPAPDADEPGRIAAATPEPEEEFGFATPMASRAPDDAPILRILRGDRNALQHAVARLAGDDGDARRRWQTRLGGLAEALIARSIEASSFEFPEGHPFWGPFSQSQNRDIAAALSSLGFRFDGFGDWVDDRVPSQRDLSMAVGYAGLDPMRVRRWPTEAETRDLLRDIRVAADEYVAGAAGGLTLGELVTLLGRRADGLTELWNDWGTVRPILLEAG